MRRSLLFSAMVVALALGAGIVRSQDQKEGGGPKPEDDVYLKMHQPNEHHAQLKLMEGDWDAAGWVQFDPTQAKVQTKGSSTFTILHGGRFCRQDFKSDMMGGMTGTGIFGYDNAKNVHTSYWVDSMTTEGMLATGKCENGCKKVVMEAKYEIMPGAPKWTWRQETTLDKDTMTFKAWNIAPADAPLPEGMAREHQAMELTYTRKKK
jgi:hypothetical protein